MLDPHVSTWLEIAARWAHVIVGIAWIGTSFYFVWLENRLEPVPDDDVAGELWSVHGGGFYRIVKFSTAPDRMPDTLHWFKWEAYSTWLTGVVMLFLVYYMGPLSTTVDPSSDLARPVVILIGLAIMLVSWVVYDALCRTPLIDHPGVLGLLALAYLLGAGWLLDELFTSRAAFIHVGAVIGTWMAGNVFFVIIPGQRQMVDAVTRGEVPDPAPGRYAAKRSLHNNYLTLPVVFIMVSNHFPVVFADEWNWAILGGLFIVGAGTRHWYNLRGRGERNVWLLPAAVAGLIVLAYVTSGTPDLPPPDTSDIDTATVVAIIETRCAVCHAAVPTQAGFTEPPKGIVLETEGQIIGLRSEIHRVSVATDFMPLGNITAMTDEERAIVGAWIDALE